MPSAPTGAIRTHRCGQDAPLGGNSTTRGGTHLSMGAAPGAPSGPGEGLFVDGAQALSADMRVALGGSQG